MCGGLRLLNKLLQLLQLGFGEDGRRGQIRERKEIQLTTKGNLVRGKVGGAVDRIVEGKRDCWQDANPLIHFTRVNQPSADSGDS